MVCVAGGTLALLLGLAGYAFGEVKIFESSVSALRWTYSPGAPVVEQPDTINSAGVDLQWEDTGVHYAGDFKYPVRVFLLAVPPGTTPQLRIENVNATPRRDGLAGRPSQAPKDTEKAERAWARLVSVNEWRGYRLARVEVYVQMGDYDQSSILKDVSLAVSFTGEATPASRATSDADVLASMALNGKEAATWWQPRAKRHSFLDQAAEAWPTFPLFRLGVEEAGLYSMDGSWLRSRGVDLIGQPSSAIKLFGNGGRPLPMPPDAPTDSVLIENSIWVDDGSDQRFDESDRIYFYGRGVKGFNWADGSYLNDAMHQSPFTRENVYFVGLDLGGTPGLRMESMPTGGDAQQISITEGREYVENDQFIFSTGLSNESGLIWYMSTIGPYESRTLTINADNIIAADTAWLTLDAEAISAVNNRFTILAGPDQTVVSEDYFVSQPFRVMIPPGVLAPGSNRIVLRNDSTGTLYVNYIELEFKRSLSAPSGTLEFYSPRGQVGTFRYAVQDLSANAHILDVTDPLHPQIATGNTIVDPAGADTQRTYFAVNPDRVRTPIYRGAKPDGTEDYPSLRDPANPAGVVILTYDAWFDLLGPLKDFHESYREEPLPTVRVKLSDVYDEFGWGVRDAVAIRNFLEYAYENWRGPDGGDTLKYVLLVGDGDYDYRNILSSADDNWMPPWEDRDIARDDFFATFDSNSNALPQLYVGRWPLQSEGEVEAAMNKTIAYATTPLYSPWKITATFAADDEWKDGRCTEYVHTEQTENLMNSVLPSYFIFKKIYEIFYPLRATPTGAQKPDATDDLIDAIDRGTLIVNFAGHGNPRIWTDEQLFVMERDHNRLDNPRMWPLFVAATCSWGQFDLPTERCFPELLLADPQDGAIAALGATRLTYSGANISFTTAFYRELFRPGLQARRSFGEALIIAKFADANQNQKLYHLFGDPVLRLATPEHFARVLTRDDSLQALALFHLSGIVSREDSGEVWSDFQGVVEARVFDTEDSSVYYWPDRYNCDLRSNNAFYYRLPGNAIFRGTASIRNGQFDVTFRVPRDVRYGGTNARISVYFYGKSDSGPDSADGIGIEEHILIANEAAAVADSIAPTITTWLEKASFRSGDLVSGAPLLHVGVADSSGVNLSGEVGHRITVRVDDAAPEDLTPYFNYDLDSYTGGGLEKNIGPLSPGEHRLVVEAWDSFNNLNQSTLTFTVGQAGEAGYAVRDVLNYPNPMKDVTCFTYSLTQGGTTNVTIKIFTLSGKLVWEERGFGTNMLFNSNSDRAWDGRDREGMQLGNGVYLYRVKAENQNGHTAEATGKLVILR